jgi:hypothetical protein
LLDGSDKQDYFVYLLSVNQVRFQGCTFKNTSRDVHYSNRGMGIFSETSGYYIEPLCRNTSNPCNDLRKTRFEKLTRGIYSMISESAPNSYIFINEAEFLDNHMGAYLSAFTGTSNAQILSRTFRNHPYSMWSYGLYLNECSGYHVENNEFFENSQSSPLNIGLIVNNSGTSPNEIYRNRFHNLKFAAILQNENRNYNPPLHLGGLCYKCNKFIKDESQPEPNRFDFAITYDGASTNTTGIAKNQGTYLSGTSFAPVGNMFQPYPAASHYDFYNEGNPVDYYYHAQTGIQYYRMQP